MVHKRTIRAVSGLLPLLFLCAGAAEKGNAQKPDRKITVAFVYPGIVLAPDDRVSVDLTVKNRGRNDETVLLEITEKPKGWKATIKGYGQEVTGVFVAEDEEKTLTFSAEPEDKKAKTLPAGTHRFTVRGKTPDGALTQETTLVVKVLKKEKPEKAVVIETSYPTLKGPSDQKFEFTIDVRNDSDEDALFNFKAEAPDGWDVSFKPSYEEKQISSLQISGNSSKSVDVQVTPPYRAKAGEYPIKVRVEGPPGSAETTLTAVLTGTYNIRLTTLTDVLSYPAHPGKELTVTLVVANHGTATQREVSFSSFKPENWEVKFEPEKLQDIEPGQFKQVDVKIKPAEEALIGDYSVQITADGERSTDDVELRITVKAPSVYGWIAVAIIALVIVGLAVVFKLLGRR